MDSTAVMGKRIGAYVIDLVIAGVISLVAAIFFLGADEWPPTAEDIAANPGLEALADIENPCDIDTRFFCEYSDGTVIFAEGGDFAAFVLISVGAWLLMHWVVSSAAGGSPGKLIVGLRVVDQQTGELAGWGKNLGRTLLWIVDSQPFGFPLVGLITGIVSKGHRRVGDMVAKTLVVDKTSVGTPPVVPGLTTEPVAATGFPPVQGGFSPPPPGGAAAPPIGEPIAPPDSFVAPPEGTPPPPEASAAPATPEPDGISAPKWDVDRNAYIQWDPELNAWMEFDDATQQWKPISQ